MKAQDERIKVLIVINALGVGGAEVMLGRIASCFEKRKFDIQVAYYDDIDIGFPAEMLKDAGIKLIYFDRRKWGRLRYMFKVASFIKQEGFDIVQAWGGTANYYGSIPAILARTPVVMGGLFGKCGPPLVWFLYSIVNLGCKKWLVNAESIKKVVLKKIKFINDKDVAVVPIGIEIGDESRFKRETKTRLDELKSGKTIVGIMGKLRPIKNHFLFLEMAGKLLDFGVAADFWIVGEGIMDKQIAEAIEKRGLKKSVKLLGHLPDIDVALSRMDIFVLTSDSEGFPVVVLEAMRASLPIISTRCTSFEGIIDEGVNGFTVPLGDSQALAEKVKKVLSNSDLKKEMGVNSRRIAKERFDILTIVKDLEDVYIKCLRQVSKKYPEIHHKLEKFDI